MRIQVMHVSTWLASEREAPLLKALFLIFAKTMIRSVDIICGDGNAAAYSLFKPKRRSDQFKGEYKTPWIMYALNHLLLALNEGKPVADRTSVSYQTSTSAEYFHRPEKRHEGSPRRYPG